MNFPRTLSTAFSSLVNNKLRSFLTMLGVIIGVAAVIIMVAVSTGAEAVIAEQINKFGRKSDHRHGFSRHARRGENPAL